MANAMVRQYSTISTLANLGSVPFKYLFQAKAIIHYYKMYLILSCQLINIICVFETLCMTFTIVIIHMDWNVIYTRIKYLHILV